MHRGTWLARLLGSVVGLGLLAPCAGSGAEAAPPATEILNSDSYLRVHYVFRTPLVLSADGQVKVALAPGTKEPQALPDFQSLLPPAGWRKPDLDDSEWSREQAPLELPPGGATGRSPAALHTATPNSLLCVRAGFVVDDPAKVHDLRLTLEYIGGVAVFVNGQEATRAHLPAGELKPDTLAEKYPDDLYCEPDGMFLQDIKKNPQGFARRYRRLDALAIPAALLRKGTNVLAVEVHRSPVNEAAIAAKRVPVGGMYVVPGLWAYAGLRSLRLAAAPGSALAPNVARPKGVQVWTCPPFATVQATDYGDPGGPLRPIVVSAARNGVSSGRLIVSSDQPIRGLKVAVSDLVEAEGGAKIPASAIRVRCAEPAVTGRSWAPTYRYDGLLDEIPAEVPVVSSKPPREAYLRQPLERKSQTMGALAPIWLTLRVAPDAKPGRYEGTATVEAEGLPPTPVPLRLTVHDWALPDPKDFRVRNLGFLSPESVARHYGMPLWSDRHLELIARSMALMAEVNSRQVTADLAISFLGLEANEESLVRWSRKPEGSFAHDFAAFDRFLDTVARAIGKPRPLRLNCWGEAKEGKWANVQTVSLLDPATGKLEPLEQPPPGTPECLAFWKPVLDEVRKRLEARGWFDVASLGHNSYCWEQNPQVVGMARRIWPDGVWSFSSHNAGLSAFKTEDKAVTMPIRYAECVWTEGRLTARGYTALLTPRQGIWCTVARNRHYERSPLTTLRDLPEEMIMRGHDGVGQLGVDIFPVKRPDGRLRHLSVGRGGMGPDCSTLALLAAGPAGPVATERFEMFREGVQLAEAILFLQRALEGGKLPDEAAQRVNRSLDQRAEAFLQHWSDGRAERDRQLLALAAEVAARLAAK
ncbi:MAG TPA: glycoside hydrolase domain-containing protein [Planctomycetota bacterium]|nr:glycoside hydrolase domain-containing protein [Planctomycetota bacterium]